MIHLQIGKELLRNTKTGCGMRVFDIPRDGGSVEYRNRRFVTCPDCLKKITNIERDYIINNKEGKIMERKYIDIQGDNIHSGPWIHTRPAKNFKFIEVNGVTFAITENNYYLDTKKDKIRYAFMDCKNCSWDHAYYIYMEAYPGIFAFCSLLLRIILPMF